MASTGETSWRKYFKDTAPIDTVIKKDSILYDSTGKTIGNIKAGTAVVALKVDSYISKYPIKTVKGDIVYVTFDNIQKPRTGRVTGIKLKPQDFSVFKNSAEKAWNVKDLAKALVDEIENRTDLDPKLKTYLSAITKYYANLDSVNSSHVDSIYDSSMQGLAELQKDYGEILGGFACITKNILTPANIKVDSNSTLLFPIRGNEPIVDYYIIKPDKTKLSISAKSGSTTNTLKAGDILSLLDQQKKTQAWSTTPVYKFIQLVNSKSAAELPFHGINIIKPGTLSSKALEEVASKFKVSNFSLKNYSVHLFSDLFKILGFDVANPPKIGELFYYTEKAVIKSMNDSYPATQLFKDATSGLVIYVKFEISSSNKHGKFEVLTSDLIKADKKIIWRSKNGTTRAADKIGLQP